MNVEVARHLLIRGRVQGVGFRWSLWQEAQRLHLNGWVRNLRDGRVEALIVGPQFAVAALIEWARCGPETARVDEVLVEETAERASGFEKRSTM